MATSDPPPERLQAPVPCEGCDTGAPGQHYCTVCRKTMCINCAEIHGKLMKEHRVVFRSEIASCMQSICKNHPYENLTFHCNKCKFPICIECLEDTHNGHSVTKLSKVIDEERVILEKEISDLNQKELDIITKSFGDLNNEEGKLKKGFENIRQETVEEIRLAKAELDNIQEDRLRSLADEEQRYLTRFSNQRKNFIKQEEAIRNAITDNNAKLTSSHDNPAQFLDFMRSREIVSVQLPAKLELQPPTFYRSTNLNFRLVDVLGKLQFSSFTENTPPSKCIAGLIKKPSLTITSPQIISSFKADVKGVPSICTTSDGYAWIGGYEFKKLILVDRQGSILKTKKVLNRPCSLALMSSGDIIMSTHYVDSTAIMRLGTDGTQTSIYDSAPTWCNGVSVTRDQHILVCTRYGRVMRLSGDGINKREIFNKGDDDSAIHAIELPDTNICISDQSNKRLLVIDKDGCNITSITRPLERTNYSPRGLACDRMGNILSTDGNNDCLYIIDQNREVKELVGPSCGIKMPRRIDIDKDDNVWIAQDSGNITVVKYLA